MKPRRMKAEREDLEDNKTCTNDTLALQVAFYVSGKAHCPDTCYVSLALNTDKEVLEILWYSGRAVHLTLQHCNVTEQKPSDCRERV